jgi:hypothetical protein
VLFSLILGNLHRFVRRRRTDPLGPDARFLARVSVAVVVLIGVIVLVWSAI